MKKTLLLLLLLFSGITLCFSQRAQESLQKVVYRYDDAGNRIKRSIVVEEITIPRQGVAVPDSNIQQVTNYSLRVYPNPTQGALGVEIQGVDEKDKIWLTIFSATGAMLYNKQGYTGLNTIDITSYTDGIYILKVKIGKKLSEYKIIKR
ncbi:MAG: T9SS type A sorting domain-containing protein [Paludibacteraceae bacterium]